METEHTKGEWTVKSNPELCWVESKTHHIATISFGNEANAKLIASAPELLQTLKHMYAVISNGGNVKEMQFDIEQAIKKATA